MKNKSYRGILSFSAADNVGVLQLDTVGIQIGRPAVSAEAKLKAIERLGMFGSGNNSNNYYPAIQSAQDIVPKPEDFIDVPFRLLSATIVGAGSWKTTDFSDAVILKGSMQKLNNKPVYKNHDCEVDNWVGMVKGVSWSEGFNNASGEYVPPGIDGILSIDAKTEPKIARGVLLGSIYSNSVTVEFDWKMSHHFEKMYDFMDSVGTFGADGKMIRRVVTRIMNYHETSLVFLGADPFAKLIDNKGNLTHIDSGGIQYSKAGDDEKKLFDDHHKIKIGYCLDKNVISLSKERLSEPNQTTTEQNTKEMDKYLLALAKILGLPIAQVTEENYVSHLAKLSVTDTKQVEKLAKATIFESFVGEGIEVAALEGEPVKVTLTGEGDKVALSTALPTDAVVISKADLVKLKKDAADLIEERTKLTALEKDAELGKTYLGLQRDECKRLYKLSVGGEGDAAVLKLMDGAEPDALAGLLKLHAKDATMKFSGSCKSCGSDEFEFKSSISGDDKKEEVKHSAAGKRFNDFANAPSSMNIRIRR